MSETKWDNLSNLKKHVLLWSWYDQGKIDPFTLSTAYPDWIKKLRALDTDNFEKIQSLTTWFDFHCENCDAEDCFGCTFEHLRTMLGMPSVKSDKETTQFICGNCGEKWNLVSPKSDIDTCPECGITVYSDKKRCA